MSDTQVLLTGLAIGESPRWHDGRLWLANWCTQQVLTVDADGTSEIALLVPTSFPLSIDWLPDGGPLLVVSGREAQLLRREPDGSLALHADLSGIADTFNEIVVDRRGNTYVNSANVIALVPANGAPRQVADGISFGNGIVVTPDGSTLIVAESHGNRLTAFDITDDGDLANRRAWAELEGCYPDGICLDAEGAVWYADVPNKCCERVSEGGRVLQTIALDRGGFACMLGGADGRTLFIAAAEWHGMDKIDADARTGQVLTARVEVPRAGRP